MPGSRICETSSQSIDTRIVKAIHRQRQVDCARADMDDVAATAGVATAAWYHIFCAMLAQRVSPSRIETHTDYGLEDCPSRLEPLCGAVIIDASGAATATE